MSRTDDLRRIGLAWNEAWNSHDVAQLVRFFAPASRFYEPSLSGPMPGVLGVTASAEKTWGDWPRAHFDAVSVTVEDSRVVVEWRTSAVHRSGLEHLLEGVDILELVGDQVQSCRVYYDTRIETPRRRRAAAAKKKPRPRSRGSRRRSSR